MSGTRDGDGAAATPGDVAGADATPDDLPADVPALPPFARQLKRLRAVSAVQQTGSVAQAAGVLHLSPSAVTRAVGEVERDLGFPIFERGSRGMIPTPAGLVLGARLRAVWDALEAAGQAAAKQAQAAEANAAAARLRQPGRLAALASGRGLECLVAIARLGSEPRVASAIGLTQPAVHGHLQELERVAELRVFQRTTRGTLLTEAGRAVLGGARLALAHLRIAQDELAAFAGRLQGRVVVGALPLSSGSLVPAAVNRVAQAHAALHITVLDGTYDAMVQQLREGDIDLIVGALRPEATHEDLRQEPLFADTLRVVVRRGHPARIGGAEGGRPQRLADLYRWPWLVPLAHTPARRAFEAALRAEALALPPQRVETNSPSVIRGLLLEGDWVGLLSPHQVRSETQRGLVALLDVPVQGTERTIGVAMRRAGQPAPGAVAFLDALRDLTAELHER